MKRIFLTATAIMSIICARSQVTTDSSTYKSRRLKVEEINLVSSYYSQTGDNAAVTGGIGSQKLTDLANTIDIKLTRYDKKWRKHSFDGELGIDHYTSASSDMIDLKANSSASHADTRVYPSLTWSIENEKKGQTLGIGASASSEYDYRSVGFNLSYSQKTKDRNGEFTVKGQAFLDRVKQILPEELRNGPEPASQARNTFVGTVSYSQIINKNLQVAIVADFASQSGFLSLPFYRVYFNDGTVHQEKLPDTRTKLPLGIRANYFLGDNVIIRTYYRYYTDNWGLKSHTANLEVPLKVSPFLSVSPFYRFYSQSAIDYFAPYRQHTAADQYYSSNYDLSGFSSNYVGAGFRVTPPNGVFGLQHVNMAELRYGRYSKNIGMNSNSISLNLKFK
ncbi:MAG: DUF3570 domain-containing protein [Chitinophagaceae bacterium]|nr:MAG: DUF3570 domain-containing protein [Chitinophagaceae bacterium]